MRECRKGRHVFNPHHLKPAELAAIGNHFLCTGVGWLNAGSFHNYDLDDKFKPLLGNGNGPFSA